MAFYNHDLFAGNGGLSSKDETAANFPEPAAISETQQR